MPGFTDRVGSWVHDLEWSAVPSHVREATLRATLQSVAGGVAGYGVPESDVAIRIALAESEHGRSSILGSGSKVPMDTAIFVNSVMFCALEQQEMHVQSGTHPLEVIAPVALALAESLRASGTAVLEAILGGTEVMIAFAVTAMESTAHGGAEGLDTAFMPSVYGAIGAAATAARLLELDGPRIGTALCHAANLASGLSECIKAGSTEYHYALGHASQVGYLSARLAEAGAPAASTAFEGPGGFYHRFAELDAKTLEAADIPARVTSHLGRNWGMPGHVYKRYPVHFPNLPYIDAAKTLRDRHTIKATEIDAIDITLNLWCELNHGGNLGPYADREATRAATAYAVGGMLARGHYSLDDVQHFDAPDILALVAKTRVGHFEDPSRANDWTSVLLSISAGGERYVYDGSVEGIPDYHLPMDELRTIGQDALQRVVGAEAAKKALNLLESLDSLSDINDLITLLCVDARNGNQATMQAISPHGAVFT